MACELNDEVGGVSGFAVTGVEVEQRTQDAALEGTNIDGAWHEGVVSNPHHSSKDASFYGTV